MTDATDRMEAGEERTTMTIQEKTRAIAEFLACEEPLQEAVVSMVGIVVDPTATPDEVSAAMATIEEALCPFSERVLKGVQRGT